MKDLELQDFVCLNEWDSSVVSIDLDHHPYVAADDNSYAVRSPEPEIRIAFFNTSVSHLAHCLLLNESSRRSIWTDDIDQMTMQEQDFRVDRYVTVVRRAIARIDPEAMNRKSQTIWPAILDGYLI